MTEPAAPQEPSRGKRAACELCYRRKRQCDGNEHTPCTRCVKKGRECIFTEKRPTGFQLRAKAFREMRGAAKQRQVPGLASAEGGAQELQLAGGSSRIGGGALIGRQFPRPTLKRARLSASPATGLVGTRENVFLSSFFVGYGYFSGINDESTARQVVFDLLSPSGPVFSGSGTLACRESAYDGDPLAFLRPGGPQMSSPPGGEQAAAHSLFWGSVAMGAILRGFDDLEVLQSYLANARTALGDCFDQGNPKTVAAFLLLAYLHSMLKDYGKAKQYSDSALIVLETAEDHLRSYGVAADAEIQHLRFTVDLNSDLEELMNPDAALTQRLLQSASQTTHSLGGLFQGPAHPEGTVMVRDRDVFRFICYSGSPCHSMFIREIMEVSHRSTPHGDSPEQLPEDTFGGSLAARRDAEAVDMLLSIVAEDVGASTSLQAGTGFFALYATLCMARYIHTKNLSRLNPAFDKLMGGLDSWRGLLRIDWTRHIMHRLGFIYLVYGDRDRYERIRNVMNNTPMLSRLSGIEDYMAEFGPHMDKIGASTCNNWQCAHWYKAVAQHSHAHRNGLSEGRELLGPLKLAEPSATWRQREGTAPYSSATTDTAPPAFLRGVSGPASSPPEPRPHPHMGMLLQSEALSRPPPSLLQRGPFPPTDQAHFWPYAGGQYQGAPPMHLGYPLQPPEWAPLVHHSELQGHPSGWNPLLHRVHGLDQHVEFASFLSPEGEDVLSSVSELDDLHFSWAAMPATSMAYPPPGWDAGPGSAMGAKGPVMPSGHFDRGPM